MESYEEILKVHNVNGTEYQCAGCKSTWNNITHVVPQDVQNIKLFFCLYCNDWIQQKHLVLEQGWTLFDEDGNMFKM